MGTIAKNLAIALCAFSLLLSCNGNTGNQSATVPQEAVAVAGNTVEQEADSLENIHVQIVAHELTNLTLIPSVEPEQLRNVMPGSWQRLQRLTAAEEQAFIASHTAVLAEVGRIMLNFQRWQRRDTHYFAIYRQQIGTDIFHRIIVTFTSSPDFMSHAIAFNQFLVFQNALFTTGTSISSPYGHTEATQNGDIIRFFSIDIIQNRERAIGVLLSNVSVGGFVYYGEEWYRSRYLERRNGQLFGSIRAEYFPLNFTIPTGRRSFEIGATDMLVDPIVPLRYGLQNAFDGNPATAFVSNTATGRSGMSVRYIPGAIQRLAIINGFTSDIATFLDYDRAKLISIFNSADGQRDYFDLGDNIASWQFFESDNSGFSVNEVFTGNRYNFTALSGFNVYTEMLGWLFGDLNEQ